MYVGDFRRNQTYLCGVFEFALASLIIIRNMASAGSTNAPTIPLPKPLITGHRSSGSRRVRQIKMHVVTLAVLLNSHYLLLGGCMWYCLQNRPHCQASNGLFFLYKHSLFKHLRRAGNAMACSHTRHNCSSSVPHLIFFFLLYPLLPSLPRCLSWAFIMAHWV